LVTLIVTTVLQEALPALFCLESDAIKFTYPHL